MRLTQKQLETHLLRAADILRGRIDPGGLTVTTVAGDQRTVAWSDFAAVVVRRLPPDPPFSKLLLIDLSTTTGSPIRLLPSSRIDWRQLPGGAAATATRPR